MSKNKKWSNLTAAIKNGDPIDWEALDSRLGRVTSNQDNHSSDLVFTFYRDTNYPAGTMEGVTESNIPPLFGGLIAKAWRGEEGLRLWVEDEIPLRPLTAADLPLGTFFADTHGYTRVVVEDGNGSLTTLPLVSSARIISASEVQVQVAYGVGTLRKAGQEGA